LFASRRSDVGESLNPPPSWWEKVGNDPPSEVGALAGIRSTGPQEAKARALGGSWVCHQLGSATVDYVQGLPLSLMSYRGALKVQRKLRESSYFPDWLLKRRRRAESALVSVVATSYLLGVSTRRMARTPSKLRMIKEVDGLQLPRGKIDRTRFSLGCRSAEEAGPCPIPAPRPRCSRS
jgi:hypothetical protein